MIRLPEVKKFLRQPGHANSYEMLTVKFVAGKNPDLFIKDDIGNIIEKIDLSKFKCNEIHDLLISKGFKRKVKVNVDLNTTTSVIVAGAIDKIVSTNQKTKFQKQNPQPRKSKQKKLRVHATDGLHL